MEQIIDKYSDNKRKPYNPEYEKLRKKIKQLHKLDPSYKEMKRGIPVRYNRFADN